MGHTARRARKFYAIFDWQLENYPMPDGSTYVGCRTVETDNTTYQPKEPGAINGGIILRTQHSKVPSITIHVPSIDEYVEKIKKAGGTLVKPCTDIEGGGYAYVADTEGNVFGLWQDKKK